MFDGCFRGLKTNKGLPEKTIDGGLNLFCGSPLCEDQFADENLSGIVEHLSFPCRQAPFPVTNGKVADDFSDFEDVAAFNFFHVGTVTSVPVLGHLRLFAFQRAEHSLDVFMLDDFAQADFFDVVEPHHHLHVADRQVHDVILGLFTQYLPLFDCFNDASAMHRIDDFVPDVEHPAETPIHVGPANKVLYIILPFPWKVVKSPRAAPLLTMRFTAPYNVLATSSLRERTT